MSDFLSQIPSVVVHESVGKPFLINSREDENDPLTYAVIGEAMRVHGELGPGLDERFYHELLSARLLAAGIVHQSKPRAQLIHRGIVADEFECDLLFREGLIAELKVLSAPETFAPEHFAQLICYLKFWRIRIGLLLDFGKERLLYRRVAFTDKPSSVKDVVKAAEQALASKAGQHAARAVCDSVVRLVEAHGLGYRDTTYRGLIAADFSAEGIPFVHQPAITIHSEGKSFGETRCDCFVIANSTALMVLALRDRITTADRSILQTYLRHLGLQTGLIVNFGKHHLDMISVGASQSTNR